MPVQFLQGLADHERTRSRNRQLGSLLAFVAGAVNAGGFMAVNRYTSHMTGIISAIADDIVLAHASTIAAGLAMLATFVSGAMCTALVMNWARRNTLGIELALPLMVEAILLLVFGLLGSRLQVAHAWVAPVTVLLLCFIMGLQNAIITKVSKAEIRTTHMTGIVTDLGIELGRLLYRNHATSLNDKHFVRADRDRLGIHATILLLFFVGGVAGAAAFRTLGFSATLPLSALLAFVAMPALLKPRA